MVTSTPPRMVRSRDVCGGRTCIEGHRVRVLDVAIWSENCGMSADEIVAQYPSLTRDDVDAALDYYSCHKEEIRQEIETERAFADSFRQSYRSLIDRALEVNRLPRPA